MNILITGAGLIGCHFAREMGLHGHQAVIYDLAPMEPYVRSVAGDVPVVKGDVRDLPALMDVIREHRVEAVFHSAGLIGPRVAEHPYTGLSINVGGAIAVGEACRLSGVRRLVFAGSFAVYNWDLPPAAPIDEDFPTTQNTFYGGSKVACEQILRAYASTYGLELALLRFAQVYGRGHYVGGSSGGIAMHGVVETASRAEPVRIDPRHFGINEYVYIEDVVQGLAMAFERPLVSRAFNIGTGVLHSPADVAEALRRACPGLQVEVLPGPAQRPGQRRDQPLDLTRAREELGYNPRFDLTRGIAAFVEELRRQARVMGQGSRVKAP